MELKRLFDDDKRKFVAIVGGLCAVNIIRSTSKQRKRRSSWVAKRSTIGHLNLVHHLKDDLPEDIKNYLRINEKDFNLLLGKIAPRLTKRNTVMRESISAADRLIATLRFLATGSSYEGLKHTTGIAAQTLGYLIPETCKVIYEEMKDEYLKMPQTSEEWQKEASLFKERWQIINCGGIIDGKHIRIIQPSGTGALYYNYKKFYSTVLMAVVNANYEFLYVDVGKEGRMSDGGVIEYTTFHEKLQNGSLNLPTNDDTDEGLNFVFVADEAFGLHAHIMKPYAERDLNPKRRVFNYRLSPARNVVENAFGLISARFRVLQTAIKMKPENINYVVLAICILHNFLMRRSSTYFKPAFVDRQLLDTGEIIPGSWRNECAENAGLQGMQPVSERHSLAAKENRDSYVTFFNTKEVLR